MALINCPECNNQVSDTAVSCPQCGAPIAKKRAKSSDKAMQKTSKSLKAQLFISGLMAAIGLLMVIFGIVNASETNSSMSSTPTIIFFIGLVWYIVVRIRIWWHHG